MGEARLERNMKLYDLKINANNKYLLIFMARIRLLLSNHVIAIDFIFYLLLLPWIFIDDIFYRRCLQARGSWLSVKTVGSVGSIFPLFLLFDTLKILPWETFPLFFANHSTVLLAVLSHFGNWAIQSFQETGPWALPNRTLRRLLWAIFLIGRVVFREFPFGSRWPLSYHLVEREKGAVTASSSL